MDNTSKTEQTQIIQTLQLQLELVREQQNLLDKTETLLNQYGTKTLQLLLGQTHANPQPEAEAIFGRSGTRVWLLKALEEAQDWGVRMVCPWLSTRSIDDEMLLRLRYLLDRGLNVHIGWGYRHDLGKMIKIESDRRTIAAQAWHNYNALPLLTQLQAKYPNQVQLKLLGCHSKYFICDRTFAYVGSHNFLNTNLPSLKTYSPDFAGDEMGTLIRLTPQIDKLIQRFERQPDLIETVQQWQTA